MLEYDNEGNVIGDSSDTFETSPISKYMGKNIDNFNDEFESMVQSAKPQRFKDPEANAAMPQFNTMGLQDLENLPDPEWIVNGYIPADGMTTIFGAPGSTKSFFALYMAFCVASGAKFFDSEVKKGKVLYVVGEGLRGMKWRIEALKLAHPEADMEALDKNLIILPKAVMLLDKMESTMLSNTAKAIAEDGDLRCFIIDTWARSLTGGDENSAQDVGNAIQLCETIRSTTSASPIIIHHTGADGQRERGSTALRGATDTTIQMNHKESEKKIEVICKKMKDGEPFQTLDLELKQFGHSVVLTKKEVLPFNYGGYKAEVRDRQYWVDKAKAEKDAPF